MLYDKAFGMDLVSTAGVSNKFEGTIERFAGDGLLVLFNDPLPCPDPSLRAVRMAVEMRREIAALAEKWRMSGH